MEKNIDTQIGSQVHRKRTDRQINRKKVIAWQIDRQKNIIDRLIENNRRQVFRLNMMNGKITGYRERKREKGYDKKRMREIERKRENEKTERKRGG